MAQVRLLAPWTNADGEPFASGEVIEVSDDEARALNNRGQASLIAEEKKQAKAQQESGGQYSARATRAGTAPLTGGQQGDDKDNPPAEEQPKKK